MTSTNHNTQLVVWEIGFDEKTVFFRLHCPVNNYSRVKLCEAAIDLMGKAWPHLRVRRNVSDNLKNLIGDGNE